MWASASKADMSVGGRGEEGGSSSCMSSSSLLLCGSEEGGEWAPPGEGGPWSKGIETDSTLGRTGKSVGRLRGRRGLETGGIAGTSWVGGGRRTGALAIGAAGDCVRHQR